jgi:7-cyano-7-deazaguanine synthase
MAFDNYASFQSKPKAVVLLSGGLDSTTLLYSVANDGYDVHGLSVDYGQRHRTEIEYAKRSAERIGGRHSTIDLTTVTRFLTGSSLTNPEVAVPEGHYADENMRVTVVPNRNAMMLTVAFAVAASEGAKRVAVAVHAGDHAIYSDCRPEFVERFQAMQDASLGEHIELYTPFLHVDKLEITRRAVRLGVPVEETWSCYNGGELHCGRCGTCVERAWAIAEAGIEDPTAYRDPGYWREVMSAAPSV